MLVPQIQDKSVTASGNIKVKLTVKLEGTPTLFNKPAVLDGSLKISALQDGREIGAGYYSPHRLRKNRSLESRIWQKPRKERSRPH